MIESRIVSENDILYLVRNLERMDSERAIKSGLRAGAQRLKSGGIRRLKARMKKPTGFTGNLLRSFKVRVKRRRPGALAGFYGDGARHVAWVDKGTKPRQQKGGRPTGIMPALRFWSDTREMDANAAMDAIYKGVERAVQRINSRR